VFWLKMLLTVAVLGVILLNVDWTAALARLGRTNLWMILLALVVLMASMVLAALRWSLVAGLHGLSLPPGAAIRISFAAQFLGQVLPSTVGADAVRCWLATRQSLPVFAVVASVVVDRLCGLIGLGLLILISAPRLLSLAGLEKGAAVAVVALLVVGGVVGTAILFGLLGRLRLRGPLARMLEVVAGSARTMASARGLGAMAMSAVIQLMIVLSVLLIAWSVGLTLAAADGITIVPPAILIAVIPVTVNGWGLREGAMITAMGLVGVSPADALVISVLFGVALLVTALPGAIAWLPSGLRGRNDTQRTEQPDVTVDARLAGHREAWIRKPSLRAVYGDFHRRLLDACPPGRLLEIGSGSGHLRELASDIVSIDILPSPWVDLAADAHRLPFADSSFSGIVMIDVLHHLERPAEFFEEATRVLRPGGRIAMIEPAITPLSWLFYNFVHEEPVDLSADPLAPVRPDPNRDPFDANQAIPTLLFSRSRGRRQFDSTFPELRLVSREWFSLFAYPLTGGFQSWNLIPAATIAPMLALERVLSPVLGRLMAFRLFVAIEKNPVSEATRV
jgi:uncharacterized membrane protein YbhN (UPF0104 family)/SAM-dependent methyltransferase